MENKQHDSQKKQTPTAVKDLFKKFLFPANEDKTPKLKAGESWLLGNDKKLQVVRSTDSPLCGIDCGQAGIVVADFDIYKKDFKNSRPANKFYKDCLKNQLLNTRLPLGDCIFGLKGRLKASILFLVWK